MLSPFRARPSGPQTGGSSVCHRASPAGLQCVKNKAPWLVPGGGRSRQLLGEEWPRPWHPLAGSAFPGLGSVSVGLPVRLARVWLRGRGRGRAARPCWLVTTVRRVPRCLACAGAHRAQVRADQLGGTGAPPGRAWARHILAAVDRAKAQTRERTCEASGAGTSVTRSGWREPVCCKRSRAELGLGARGLFSGDREPGKPRRQELLWREVIHTSMCLASAGQALQIGRCHFLGNWHLLGGAWCGPGRWDGK